MYHPVLPAGSKCKIWTYLIRCIGKPSFARVLLRLHVGMEGWVQ